MSRRLYTVFSMLILLSMSILPLSAQVAISGTQAMNASDLAALGSVTITPGGVLTLDFGFGAASLSGDFINSGTVHAVSSVPTVTTAQLSASQFINNSGAVFSSSPNLNLSFNVGSFINHGLVQSGGDLTIQATNSIVNSGTLTSMMGNININTLVRDTVINNVSGLIQAKTGVINIGSAALSNGSITAIGGDWIAKEINAIAHDGTIDINVNKLDAVLNTTTGALHVTASTDNLVLGAVTCSGDPTFYNGAGSITITAPLNFSEDLAIIASGDITTDAAATSITAQNPGVSGQNIYLIAGAQIIVAAPPSTNVLPGPNTIGGLVIDGASTSATGGNIDFSNTPTLTISSAGSCVGCAGGNIVLAAFRNGLGGAITIPAGASLSSNGNGANNGNITIVGGSNVFVGNLDSSTGGTAGTGTITIATAQPRSSDLGFIIFVDGSITSGNQIVAGATTPGSDMFLNGTILAGNALNADSGNFMIFNAPATAGTMQLNAATSLTNNFSLNATNETLNITTPTVLTNGDMNVSGANPTLTFDSPTTSFNLSGSGDMTTFATNPFGGTINYGTTQTLVNATTTGAMSTDNLNVSGVDGYSSTIAANSVSATTDFAFINAPAFASVTLQNGDLNVCGCLTLTRPGFSGGDVFLTAVNGAVNLDGGIDATGDGVGNSGGTISIAGETGVTSFGIVRSDGINGADAGSISLSSNAGPIGIIDPSDSAVSANASNGGGNGGSVFLTAQDVLLLPGSLAAIDVTSGPSGNGGTVLVNTNSINQLVLGGCGCLPNQIVGAIAADGAAQGGFVQISSNGLQLDSGLFISASGPQAGKIAISGSTFNGGPVAANIDGDLVALGFDGLGRIGFASGGAPITVTSGGGNFFANDLTFGTLDPTTLFPVNAVFPPVTNPFTYGNISATFGGGFFPGTFIVSGPSPTPTPPSPTPVPAPVIPTFITQVVIPNLVPRLGEFPSGPSTTILPTDLEVQIYGLRNGDETDTDAKTLQGYVAAVDEAAGILNSGRLIVVSDQNAIINTSRGEIHANPGDILFLIETPNVVSLYNLHDEQEGSVFMVIDGKTVAVPLGVQILATKSDGSFQGLNPAPMVSTRGSSKSSTPAGTNVFAAEYSLPAAIRWIEPIKKLRNSNDTIERAVVDKIMRNAAILMMLTARNGSYKQQ